MAMDLTDARDFLNAEMDRQASTAVTMAPTTAEVRSVYSIALVRIACLIQALDMSPDHVEGFAKEARIAIDVAEYSLNNLLASQMPCAGSA